MKKILVLTLFILSLSVLSFSQDSTKKTFGKNVVEYKYDKFKDKTTVTLELTLLEQSDFENLRVIASVSFVGKKATSIPSNVPFLFFSVNKERIYYVYRSLIFLADDERVNLGDGKYEEDKSFSNTIEMLTFSINSESFGKIAKAKKLEMQLGKTEHTFTDLQIEAVKEFYNYLIP